jgi:hypothetical protein
MAASYSWSFNTVCPGAPVVTATVPVSGAINVARTSKVTVTFNKQLASSTVSTTSFHVRKSGSSVDIESVVNLSSNLLSVEIVPTQPLPYFDVFKGFVDNSVKEVLGVLSMVASYSWSFTTTEPSYVPIYNVTHIAGAYITLAGFNRAGNVLQVGTSLKGHKVKKATFHLKRTGTLLSGLVYCRIRNSADIIKAELGSIPASGISTIAATYTFTNLSADYAFVVGDRFLIENLSGSASPAQKYIHVGYNNDLVSNTVAQYYTPPPYTDPGWNTLAETDIAAILYEVSI